MNDVGLLKRNHLIRHKGLTQVLLRSVYLCFSYSFSLFKPIRNLSASARGPVIWPSLGFNASCAYIKYPSVVSLWQSKTTWSQEIKHKLRDSSSRWPRMSWDQNSQPPRPSPQPSPTNADLIWSFQSNSLNSPNYCYRFSHWVCPLWVIVLFPDLLQAQEISFLKSSCISVNSTPSFPPTGCSPLVLPSRVFLKTHFLDLSPGTAWATGAEQSVRALGSGGPTEKGGAGFWRPTSGPATLPTPFFHKYLLST